MLYSLAHVCLHSQNFFSHTGGISSVSLSQPAVPGFVYLPYEYDMEILPIQLYVPVPSAASPPASGASGALADAASPFHLVHPWWLQGGGPVG